MRISPSQLQMFMNCPLQWKFTKIDRLPTRQNGKASFGSVIHKALEIYNDTGNIDLAQTVFRENWANPEKMGVKPDYWPKYTTYNSLKAKGVEILDAYHEKQKWESRTVLAQEHHFLVPMGEHELEGIVDVVELRKAGNGHLSLRIIDYKTASRMPTIPTLRFNLQFSVYMYASLQPEFWLGNEQDPEKFLPIPNGEQWFHDLRKTQRRGIWYHLMTNKEINAGDRDDGDYLRLYRLLKEIEKAMEANVYMPDISADTCVYCDFTQQCGIEIPSREELLSEIL